MAAGFNMRVLEEAAELIKASDSKRKALASKLIAISKSSKGIGEANEPLILPVKRIKLDATIAGVDSGFMSESLLSVEIVLVRAMAAIFQYNNGRLFRAEYWPEFVPLPEPIITAKTMQKEDLGTHKSLQRLLREINLAQEVIKRFNPEYCFLDGSIIPQHADKPRNNSRIKPLYKDVINAFEKLFKTAEHNKCTLIACVEDSRGTRLKEMLANLDKKIAEADCYDVSLLNYALKEAERTCIFSYAKSAKEHPVLQDFSKDYASKLYAFYLRASDYDIPLRVEFLASNTNLSDDANRIASTVYALSSMHREYSYPSVLIEADLRARLKPAEVNAIMDKIFDKLQLNAGFLMKRRSRRPF